MYQAKRKDEPRILDCVCKDLPAKSRCGRKRMSSSLWKGDCKSVQMIFCITQPSGNCLEVFSLRKAKM